MSKNPPEKPAPPHSIESLLDPYKKSDRLIEGAGGGRYNKETAFTAWDMIVPAGAQIQWGNKSEEISFQDPKERDADGNPYLIIINLKRGTMRRGIDIYYGDRLTNPGIIPLGNTRTFQDFRNDIHDSIKNLPILDQTVPIQDWDTALGCLGIQNFYQKNNIVIGDLGPHSNLMYIIDFDEGTLTLRQKPDHLKEGWEKINYREHLDIEKKVVGATIYKELTLKKLAEIIDVDVKRLMEKTGEDIKKTIN